MSGIQDLLVTARKSNHVKKRCLYAVIVVLLVVVFLSLFNLPYVREIRQLTALNEHAENVAREHHCDLYQNFRVNRFENIKEYLPYSYRRNLHDIRQLNINNKATDDDVIAVVESLKDIKTLTTINIHNEGLITKRSYKAIASLKYIEEISDSNEQANDEKISELENCPALKRLHLWLNKKIIGTCLKDLATIETLEELNLNSTGVTDATVKDLAQSPSLKLLKLSGSQVTKNCLPDLAKIKTLVECEINLPGYSVQNKMSLSIDDIKKIRDYKFLRKLEFYKGHFAVPHRARFEKGKRIPLTKDQQQENLDFWNACLKEIVGMSHCEKLSLGFIPVPEEYVRQICSMKSLKKVTFSFCSLSPESYEYLKANWQGDCYQSEQSSEIVYCSPVKKKKR